MTNKEMYTIDTTPFRVKIDEPEPGVYGECLRKWNALKLNIDRHKTVWDEGGAGVYPEELYPQSIKKVWAVCIQCGKCRWVRYQDYRDMCYDCSMKSDKTRKKISDNHADFSGKNHYMFGKHMSEKARIKSSCAQRGIALEEFPGFTHDEHAIFRNSGEYAKWRTAVFERDNYTCQECGVHGGEIEAHHITPFNIHPEPEYSLDIDNGITLCDICHKKIRGHEDEFYNKYTAIVKANSGFKDDFLSSSVILEGLKKQNDPHLIRQPTIFDY